MRSIVFFAVLLCSFACSPSVPPGTAESVPELSGTSLDGKTISLADYKGKVVLVDFWATWCGPCKAEIPELVKLQEELGPKGLVVLGVSMDDEPESVPAFAKKMKINYPVLVGGGEIAPKGWIVPGLPTAYLIGRDGKAVLRLFGAKSVAKLRVEVEAALAR